MSILVVGTVAFDSIETPFGSAERILGGSASSRLFQEIREKRGMAYSVYTYGSQYMETGQVGIESIWEGRYVHGAWRPGRLLNGDESHQGRHLPLPPGRFGIQRLRLYRYR